MSYGQSMTSEACRCEGSALSRKSFGGSVIRLEPDVAEVFPSAESVNEALRFLIKVTKENKPPIRESRGDA